MVGLPKVYQDIYETSKDVVRLKQRHLVKEVLERLNFIVLPKDTTITTLTNEQVRFYFDDILSLISDNDSTIQAQTIDAIEKLLSNLKPTAYHNNSEWPIIRDRIVEDYTKHITKIRDSSNNSNWYKIWCLLIQVLDQDIIRSVHIINKFLAIVEQSFKSPDLDVRAQAFICWKMIVEMFFKYNELIPSKRVKLVSIPFRSSQAKNLYAAETKFDAYWYFLVKLSESPVKNGDENIKNSLELHHDLVFIPFLQFCFGVTVKGGISTLKQFPKMKEMTVLTLIAMVNPNHNDIKAKLQSFNLEIPKEVIITEMLMKNNWKAIMKCCFEATLVIVEQCNGKKKLLELLWDGLIHQTLRSKNPEIYKEFSSMIKQLIETDKDKPEYLLKSNILHIVESFGLNYNYLYDINSNTANYVQIFEIITCLTEILLLSENHYFPPNIFEPVIKNIYDLEKYNNLNKYWELQKDLIEYMLTTDQLNDFNNFHVKVAIWKMISIVLRNYMDAKLFEFRLQSKSEVVNKWIVWPLKKCGWSDEIDNRTVTTAFDNTFFSIWKRLMHSSSVAEGKSNFINLLIPSFKLLCDKREKINNFDDVIACYIDCMDNNFERTSKPTEPLELIRTIFSKTPSKNGTYNKSVDKFSNYICSLNDTQIGLIFEELKAITSTLVQADKLKHITKNCFEMYKKSVINLLKKESIDKKYLKEFRNALKSDEFVIIPSVWALNPDRLTEHQKEKMKEKKDYIPALYNDMNSDSHSQDSSSIKPWTPNKIVIPRGKEQLIISSPKTSIEKNGTETDNSEIAKTEIEKSPFKKPKEKSIVITPNKSPFKSPFRSPFKNTKEKIEGSPNKNKENNEINILQTESSEKKNIEKSVINIKDKEKEKEFNISKIKTSEQKKKMKISAKGERLLKSMNIEVQDEKKKMAILSSLKALEIDTIEGNNLLKSQYKGVDRGIRTRKCANPKRITNDMKKNKATNKSRKQIFKEEIAQDSNKKENELGNKLEKEEKNSALKAETINVEEDIKKESRKALQKKLQISNISLNSEDEVIESSQKPEDNNSRRIVRRSSVNFGNIKNGSKNTITMNSPAEPQVKNIKKRRKTKTPVLISLGVDGKVRPLRSSSTSPMVEENVKNKKPSSAEKSSKKKENRDISEMETELNTELEESNKTSDLNQIENTISSEIKRKDNKNKMKEDKTTDHEQKQTTNHNTSTQLNTEVTESLIRSNLLPEYVIESSDLKYRKTSPRKRLHYDDMDVDMEKQNDVEKRNNLVNLESDENSSDSVILSLTTSPQELGLHKTGRTLLSSLIVNNSEISPKMQKILDALDGKSPKKLRQSPRKSPNQQQAQDIFEIETELNTEIAITKQKISEMETELNTEHLNVSTVNKSNAPASPRTPTRNNDVYKYIDDKALESPAYSPIKPLTNSLKKTLNQSIIASPECRNSKLKDEEFLSDTLNISPIPVENFEKSSKNANDTNDVEKLFDELKAVENEKSFEELKNMSPSRKTIKPASLNSPPDRKNTNNSTSPGPKTKSQAGLTGRGAQLINMIRNRKMDPSNRFTSSPFRSTKQDELTSSQEKQQNQNVPNSPSPKKETCDNNNSAVKAPPTPVTGPHNLRDLLTFSKVLPSPHASPSASILKRKLRKESFDDFESPANKRKRVSFHDPPVSVTKEYVKHIEEEKPQARLHKMLQERSSTPSNFLIKHSLKRKNRIDSMIELARYSDSPIRIIEIPARKSIENIVNDVDLEDIDNAKQPILIPNSDITTTELQECDSSKHIIVVDPIDRLPQTSVIMDSLKFNATADSTTNPQLLTHQCVNIEENDEQHRTTPAPSIYFTDEAAVLKYVVEKYGFDEIYEKYSERENKDFLTNKLVRTIFKDLAVVMEKDVKIRTNVLEMLSENHPKEFLDHAIQENLSFVVCERLNTNSVIDFICETFKNNADSRKMILDKISNILTMDQFNQERHDYFVKLLHYEKMSSEEVLNCIEIISKNRR